MVFSVALIGGFVFWIGTTFRTPVSPSKLIVPYLIAVVFFIIHVYEEYLTDFEVVVSSIMGFQVSEKNFLSIAAFAGPFIWLIGAVLLWKQTDFDYFLVSFFLVAMTIAELSHFVFPFIEDGTFH